MWKSLIFSDDVVDRVHQLALNEDQQIVADKFKFEWSMAQKWVKGIIIKMKETYVK